MSINRIRQLSLFLIFTIPHVSIAADLYLVEQAQNKIISELGLMSLEGQDKILKKYAEILESNDPKNQTVKVEYDPDRSQILSYASVTEEFSQNYDKAKFERMLSDQMAANCSSQLNVTFRDNGISQKVLYLKKDSNEIFAGIEVLPYGGGALTTICDSEGLEKYGESMCPTAAKLMTDCIKPLNWRDHQYVSSELSKQEECELEIKYTIEKEYDVGLGENRNTNFVKKIRDEYHLKSEKCKPWWKLWE